MSIFFFKNLATQYLHVMSFIKWSNFWNKYFMYIQSGDICLSLITLQKFCKPGVVTYNRLCLLVSYVVQLHTIYSQLYSFQLWVLVYEHLFLTVSSNQSCVIKTINVFNNTDIIIMIITMHISMLIQYNCHNTQKRCGWFMFISIQYN